MRGHFSVLSDEDRSCSTRAQVVQEPEKKFAAMFAGQCLPMGSDRVGECQGRRTKRGGRTGPSSFQSAALPTELPGQTAPLNNVGGSGTLCRKLCRSICADGCTRCSSVRKPAKKTAARHSGAEFGDRWSTLRFGDPRATLRVRRRHSWGRATSWRSRWRQRPRAASSPPPNGRGRPFINKRPSSWMSSTG